MATIQLPNNMADHPVATLGTPPGIGFNHQKMSERILIPEIPSSENIVKKLKKYLKEENDISSINSFEELDDLPDERHGELFMIAARLGHIHHKPLSIDDIMDDEVGNNRVARLNPHVKSSHLKPRDRLITTPDYEMNSKYGSGKVRDKLFARPESEMNSRFSPVTMVVAKKIQEIIQNTIMPKYQYEHFQGDITHMNIKEDIRTNTYNVLNDMELYVTDLYNKFDLIKIYSDWGAVNININDFLIELDNSIKNSRFGRVVGKRPSFSSGTIGIGTRGI